MALDPTTGARTARPKRKRRPEPKPVYRSSDSGEAARFLEQERQRARRDHARAAATRTAAEGRFHTDPRNMQRVAALERQRRTAEELLDKMRARRATEEAAEKRYADPGRTIRAAVDTEVARSGRSRMDVLADAGGKSFKLTDALRGIGSDIKAEFDPGEPDRDIFAKDPKRQLQTAGFGEGELISNAAKEGAAIVHGIPKAGYLLASAIARGDAGDLKSAFVDPQVEYAKRKYGPLLPGGRPAGETLEEMKKEPLSTALDFLAGAGAVTGTVTRSAKFTKAPGGPRARYRASKAPGPPRYVRSGQADVQFPRSPSSITAAGQRGYDRLSEFLDRAAVPGTRALSARSRVAKQEARNIRQDVRRREAAAAGAARTIHRTGGKPATFGKIRDRAERTGLFWEAQLPASARGGEGLRRLATHFRQLADDTDDIRGKRRLLVEAAKVERAIGKKYDPDAVAAAGRLMDERRDIFEAAGKLDPEGATAREGLVARELGYDDATGAVYVGHRTKKPPMSIGKLGLTRPGLGKTRTPPGIGQENTLAALRSGRVRTDPDSIVEDWQRGQVYDFHNRSKDFLGKMGEPIEGRPQQGWYVVNPQGHKLPREWKDVDPAQKAAAEGFNPDDVLFRDVEEYIGNYIARAGTPEADALIRKSPGDVVQVRPEVVNQFFNRFTGKAGVSFGSTNVALKGIDMGNDLLRLSLIYANPGYIPANLIGNTGFAVVHQGPFYLPGNLVRSANIMRGGKNRGLRDLVLAEIGMGPTTAVVSGARNLPSRAVRKVAQAEGRVADDWIRGAAWLHEARKAGYRKPDAQKKLLQAAARGDKRAREIANDIRDKQNVAMVDFERLGPFENAFARRALFVWPWIRGATRYPFRMAADHPARSAAISHAALEADRDPSLEVPGMPGFLAGSIPASPAERGLQKIINPRSTSIVSTPAELVATIAEGISGEGSENLIDLASPLYRMGANAATGRNRYGQRVGAVNALKEDLGSMSPLYTTAREVIDPSRASSLYGPQTRGEVLRRKLGRGAIPYQVDLEKARTMGAREEALVPHERAFREVFRERTSFWEAAKNVAPAQLQNGKLPPDLQDAFNRKATVARLRARVDSDTDPGVDRELAKFEGEVKLLGEWGVLPSNRVGVALRWAQTAPAAEIVTYRRKLSSSPDYFPGAYLDRILKARTFLREMGADL